MGGLLLQGEERCGDWEGCPVCPPPNLLLTRIYQYIFSRAVDFIIFTLTTPVGMADAVREFVYTAMELLQVATVTVATDRIAAAADEIDPSYSPSGANVYRI